MKFKIIILLLFAFSLFTACSNIKTKELEKNKNLVEPIQKECCQ